MRKSKTRSRRLARRSIAGLVAVLVAAAVILTGAVAQAAGHPGRPKPFTVDVGAFGKKW